MLSVSWRRRPSPVTRNYSGWRMSGSIMGDVVVVICEQVPGAYTGKIPYDELVVRNEGGLPNAEIAR